MSIQEILFSVIDNWELLGAILAALFACYKHITAGEYKKALQDFIFAVEEWTEHHDDKSVKRTVERKNNPAIEKEVKKITK